MRAREFIIERKKRSKKTRGLGGYFFPGYGFYGGDAGEGGGDGGGGESKNLGMAEGKIRLYTDPDYFGAEVDDYQASGPVVNIPVDLLVGFEPDSKMQQPKSKANVEKIIAGIKRGDDIPPILVREYKDRYQILDGHHRFQAYKLLGVKSIPAQVVPDSDIEEISKPGVAEDAENFNGIELSMKIEKDDEYVDDEDYDNQVIYVTASSNGRELGHVLFSYDGEYLMPQDLEVEEKYRGQGIAQIMYDYVKSKGYKIRRSGQQTDAGAGFWGKHRPEQNVWENFADGKVKGKSRPGRVKRSGASCDGSVTDLRARAKKASGERAKMYHWCANMKSGRKKTNEVTVGVLTLGEFTVNLDDHALDRAQERRIKSTDIDTVLKKIKLPRVIKKIMAIDLGSRFYVLDHSSNVALGFRRIGDKKLVLKTVYPGRPMDHNIATIITI